MVDLRALSRRIADTGFETSATTEWAWVVGRVVLVFVLAAGNVLFLRDVSAYSTIFLLLGVVVVYDAAVVLLLTRGQPRTAFLTGFLCDNAILAFGWWIVARAMEPLPESNDLYLILLPVLTVAAVRLGWLLGALYGVFWIGWMAVMTLLYADHSRYDFEQLPLRVLFFAVTTGLVLRLVSRLTREKMRAEQASEGHRQINADLDRLVQERTAQLEAVNVELESFTYSVSHDLRNPLWVIDAFSEALEKRHAGQLDDEGFRHLALIRSAAQRSQTIVKSLLDLSRIDRHTIQPQPVDLSAMAEQIITELRLAEPGREVQVTITPGVIAQGDPDLLRIGIDNLVRNAWKYSGKNRIARIEFSQTFVEGQRACFVRDNGVGFDSSEAQRLFTPFTRLHSRDEFDGIGIGLTTVDRVVRRHGGRVWAEGAKGEGATFYFTLPGPENAPSSSSCSAAEAALS